MEKDPILEEAEQFKHKGNQFFREFHYDKAVVEYTHAISILPDKKQSAIYYSNRANAQLKLENYGFADDDASKAIQLDPSYAKAYLRKADANIIIDKYEIAFQNLKKVFIGLNIKTPDVQEKYNFVKKVLKQKAFAQAIQREEDQPEVLNPNDYVVEETYDGPKIDGINDSGDFELSQDWIVQLTEYIKGQKKLHKKYIVMILNKALEMLKKLPSLVDIEIEEFDQQEVKMKQLFVEIHTDNFMIY